MSIVEDVRKDVEKARRGSLEIRSEPAAAQAYVDGKYVGVTPTFAEGLVVGEHWVTLKKEGFKKAVMAAQVSAKAGLFVGFGGAGVVEGRMAAKEPSRLARPA